MPIFTNEERTPVKSIVATLSIKRLQPEIIKEPIESMDCSTLER